jgi:histidyl-tRNA synthetase
MRAIDKLDKLPSSAVETLLGQDAGLDAEQTRLCLALADIRTPDRGFAEQVRALGVKHELLDEGMDELSAVLDGCTAVSGERLRVEADLRIARGLDYYTGTVFETRMTGFEGLGSICSGGRYDELARDGQASYPGVGISLGVTRLLVPLLAQGRLRGSRPVPSAVLVAVVDEASRGASDLVAAALRRRGIPVEVAATAAKFGRQIRSAQRRGIPFVWFPGAQHEVKDIRSGAQVPADPDAWAPPEADRWPIVEVGP